MIKCIQHYQQNDVTVSEFLEILLNFNNKLDIS